MVDLKIPGDLPSPTALRELGDGDLVRLLMRGYGEAMTVVFDRYYAVMMRVALRILRNRAEAEDTVQVAFADFYRQVQLFDEAKGNLRGWLLQYVYGRSLNRIKTLKVRHYSDHIELSDVPPAELACPREGVLALNQPEARVMVEQVLGMLDERKRRIVELVCFGGLTIPEVAALTEEPRSRIQNQYYRAIAALRRTVQEPNAVPHATAPPHASVHKLTKGLSVDPQKEVELG